MKCSAGPVPDAHPWNALSYRLIDATTWGMPRNRSLHTMPLVLEEAPRVRDQRLVRQELVEPLDIRTGDSHDRPGRRIAVEARVARLALPLVEGVELQLDGTREGSAPPFELELETSVPTAMCWRL